MYKKTFILLIMVFSMSILWAQNGNQSRIPLIGEAAPSFKANSTNGKINFPKDFGTSWKILFSHPRDFTPVCTSEVLQLARMQKDFKELNVKIGVISTESIDQHLMWKKSIEEIQQEGFPSVQINFPIFDDEDASVSKKYGMLHQNVSTTEDVRGVFIINPDNNIESINFYPMRVGRNMDEIKRTIVALQTVAKNNVLAPVNWKPGGDILLPYSPYPNKEIEENPKLQAQYYQVGNVMWYKKAN